MMPIGSEVIHSGKTWNNQVHFIQPVWGVKKSPVEDENSSHHTNNETTKSFSELLSENISKVNDDQIAVTKITEKMITTPEEVEVHDVIITMEKARQSLNLAQNVIDRLVMGWNEIKNINV